MGETLTLRAVKNSKIIVITGATKGLGRAMAEKFIELGHTVLGCGRSQGEIEKLRQAYPAPHDFDVLNVANDIPVQKWASRLLNKYGPPDFLINNAGIINKNAPLWKISDQEFSLVLDVNLKGVANTIRHFVPAMVQNKKGIIVNFSSGWGKMGAPDVAPYCTTKFGVEGLSQSLAEELPKGMASIPLSPGIIHTRMLESCFGGDASSYPSPQKWAEKAVPYILSITPKQNGKSLAIP